MSGSSSGGFGNQSFGYPQMPRQPSMPAWGGQYQKPWQPDPGYGQMTWNPGQAEMQKGYQPGYNPPPSGLQPTEGNPFEGQRRDQLAGVGGLFGGEGYRLGG